MMKRELQERLEALNEKAKPKKTIDFNDDEYEVLERAYIALDLDKNIFAGIVFADMRAIIDNKSKWDFMISARDHYLAELQYEHDINKIEDMEKEIRQLKERKELYEKKRRCYRLPSNHYAE